MLIILIILICMYFILKDILSGKKKIIWHEEKHIEIDYDQETDDITNMIIYSSIIDSSVHSIPDCSTMDFHSCDTHSHVCDVSSHNCD